MQQDVVPGLELDDISAILLRAKELGFQGFGGACGEAAIAINRVIFGGAGTLVGAFNEAFLEHGRAIGHVAVLLGGRYWDADGEPKELEDVESWGMLDPVDEDHAEEAERLGFAWDEDAAYAVSMVEFEGESEVMLRFGVERIGRLSDILRQARQEHERDWAGSPAV